MTPVARKKKKKKKKKNKHPSTTKNKKKPKQTQKKKKPNTKKQNTTNPQKKKKKKHQKGARAIVESHECFGQRNAGAAGEDKKVWGDRWSAEQEKAALGGGIRAARSGREFQSASERRARAEKAHGIGSGKNGKPSEQEKEGCQLRLVGKGSVRRRETHAKISLKMRKGKNEVQKHSPLEKPRASNKWMSCRVDQAGQSSGGKLGKFQLGLFTSKRGAGGRQSRASSHGRSGLRL